MLQAITAAGPVKSNRLADGLYGIGPIESYYMPELKSKPALSQEMQVKYKDALADYGKVKTAWDNKNSAYSQARRARTESTDKVTDYVEAIRCMAERIKNLRAEFDRYIALADGDRKVAATFLFNAWADDVIELLPELVKEYGLNVD